MAQAEGVDMSVGTDCMKWWMENKDKLLNLSSTAKKVLVMQLSPAAVKRIFLILTTSFGSQQDSSLKHYIESSLMSRYNKH